MRAAWIHRQWTPRLGPSHRVTLSVCPEMRPNAPRFPAIALTLPIVRGGGSFPVPDPS